MATPKKPAPKAPPRPAGGTNPFVKKAAAARAKMRGKPAC